MIQKKICMIGAFAVGKASLVSRFVHHTFSENARWGLMLRDLAGQDEFEHVRTSYVSGSSGYVLNAHD